jgi:hypothetical protein
MEWIRDRIIVLRGGDLYLESIAGHAINVRLHESFAIFISLGRICVEETFVSRRLSLRASTAAGEMGIVEHVVIQQLIGLRFNPFRIQCICDSGVRYLHRCCAGGKRPHFLNDERPRSLRF